MLLKSENSQAHIISIQVPINISDEKIISNVGVKSEAFYYIMEFYQTGKVAWPTESENVTCKQPEEELDYFQIPFNKSTIICSSALETARNNLNNIIWGFDELIIRCCNYLINNIKFEIGSSGIRVI
ncbi:10583_t:CDS:2 [Dentiscutata erythropus]|uniref:10583_t:CDS:1 n=1 Tax=Dentiscutata erythropus TaxID=1348616 RepID=A0A9N8ZQ33_9GLOM|nr:10583_t:CDS:2 [Dentiscutata erythropus]